MRLGIVLRQKSLQFVVLKHLEPIFTNLVGQVDMFIKKNDGVV